MKIKHYLDLTKIKASSEKTELINHFLNTYLIAWPKFSSSTVSNKNVYLSIRVKYKPNTSYKTEGHSTESYREIIGYPFNDSNESSIWVDIVKDNFFTALKNREIDLNNIKALYIALTFN